MKPRKIVKIHTDDLLNLTILAIAGAGEDTEIASWIGERVQEIHPFLDRNQRRLLYLRMESSELSLFRELSFVMRYRK